GVVNILVSARLFLGGLSLSFLCAHVSEKIVFRIHYRIELPSNLGRRFLLTFLNGDKLTCFPASLLNQRIAKPSLPSLGGDVWHPIVMIFESFRHGNIAVFSFS